MVLERHPSRGAKRLWTRKFPAHTSRGCVRFDLVRFGLAIEAAEVTPSHREAICWTALFDVGDVHWDTFEAELRRLATLGYTFPEVG